MTTSILAHKLMTVKLDKSEFVKVKWLRKNTTEETHKATDFLQKILVKQTSHKVCRLCLRPGGKKIFGNTDNDLVKDIKYVLGIEISESDGRPQHICSPCFEMLQSATLLKQTAETTQWRLQQELDMVRDSTSVVDEPEPKKQYGGYFSSNGAQIVREWACKKCPRTFQSEEEYNEHVKHPSCRDRSKCFVCEICGRALRTLTLLKRHRMIHTNEPGEFQCSVCAYRARTKYALVVHERWHSGARPLQCPQCAKTFPNASTLWTHKKRHLPPTHHCQLCPKSFRYKELLVDHIASQHGTEKPFHCDACGKDFATRKKILRHERRVHNRPRMRVLEKTYQGQGGAPPND